MAGEDSAKKHYDKWLELVSGTEKNKKYKEEAAILREQFSESKYTQRVDNFLKAWENCYWPFDAGYAQVVYDDEHIYSIGRVSISDLNNPQERSGAFTPGELTVESLKESLLSPIVVADEEELKRLAKEAGIPEKGWVYRSIEMGASALDDDDAQESVEELVLELEKRSDLMKKRMEIGRELTPEEKQDVEKKAEKRVKERVKKSVKEREEKEEKEKEKRKKEAERRAKEQDRRAKERAKKEAAKKAAEKQLRDAQDAQYRAAQQALEMQRSASYNLAYDYFHKANILFWAGNIPWMIICVIASIRYFISERDLLFTFFYLVLTFGIPFFANRMMTSRVKDEKNKRENDEDQFLLEYIEAGKKTKKRFTFLFILLLVALLIFVVLYLTGGVTAFLEMIR